MRVGVEHTEAVVDMVVVEVCFLVLVAEVVEEIGRVETAAGAEVKPATYCCATGTKVLHAVEGKVKNLIFFLKKN